MFKSYIKDYIDDFIKEKRFCGYVYNTEEKELIRFDNFLYINNIKIINKDVIDLWVNLHPNWSINAKARSINVIRELLNYLKVHEVNDYLIPKKVYKQKAYKYIPYIFSEEEIKLLIKNAYNFTSKSYLEMKYIMPLLISLLYSTGMRIGEVLNIKKNDFDASENTIILHCTKNGTERLVVLNDNLNNRVKEYIIKINNDSDYLFSNKKGNKLNISTISLAFHKLLDVSNIKRTDHGPRLHDLRHTFIIHSFRKYYETGKDIYTFLPILQVYVGHTSFKSLEYYLRTTSIDFDKLRTISEDYLSYLIPSLESDNNE